MHHPFRDPAQGAIGTEQVQNECSTRQGRGLVGGSAYFNVGPGHFSRRLSGIPSRIEIAVRTEPTARSERRDPRRVSRVAGKVPQAPHASVGLWGIHRDHGNTSVCLHESTVNTQSRCDPGQVRCACRSYRAINTDPTVIPPLVPALNHGTHLTVRPQLPNPL